MGSSGEAAMISISISSFSASALSKAAFATFVTQTSRTTAHRKKPRKMKKYQVNFQII